MPDLQKLIRYILGTAFCCYAFIALLYASYWAHSSHLLIAIMSTALVAASLLLTNWLQRFELSADIDAERATRILWMIIGIGIVIRAIWVTVIPPVQQSDFLDYLLAAARLVEEGRYYYPDGDGLLLAWRPPGYPLILSVLIRVFGNASWLPFAINLVCFTVTCIAVRSLVDRLIGNRTAGLFATALIAFWPASIAGAGYAASEWPSLALLTVGFWAIIKAQGGLWRYAVLAGLCMGYGALVRPGLVFLPICWFIYFAVTRQINRRSFAVNLVAMIMAIAVIAPWSIRNYQVLHAFVPISTNGGDVFYRSNNPLATGFYTIKGERDLAALRGDEVLWNRTGFAWGIEWILSDPGGFLSLILKKQAMYSGKDTSMIYWAMERAYDDTGPLYVLLRLVTNWYWTAILILIAVAAIRARHWLFGNPVGGLMVVTLLYVLSVHSVFESHSRHHLPLFGLMAILATMAIWRPLASAETSGSQ